MFNRDIPSCGDKRTSQSLNATNAQQTETPNMPQTVHTANSVGLAAFERVTQSSDDSQAASTIILKVPYVSPAITQDEVEEEEEIDEDEDIPVPEEIVELVDEIKAEGPKNWLTIVHQIIDMLIEDEGAALTFMFQVSSQLGDDVYKYRELYLALQKFSPTTNITVYSIVSTIQVRMLELGFIICKTEINQQITYLGLPKELVDRVVGENKYHITLNGDIQPFSAMIGFKDNIVDPCGNVAGFDLLVHLTERLHEHPSRILQDYLQALYTKIAEHYRNPQSKLFLTQPQVERLLTLEASVVNVLRSAHAS